jgi:ribosomal protein S20
MMSKIKQMMQREEIVKILQIIICQELRNQNYYLMTSRTLEKACLGRLRKHHLTKAIDKETALACYIEALDNLINDGLIHEKQTNRRITISL